MISNDLVKQYNDNILKTETHINDLKDDMNKILENKEIIHLNNMVTTKESIIKNLIDDDRDKDTIILKMIIIFVFLIIFMVILIVLKLLKFNHIIITMLCFTVICIFSLFIYITIYRNI